MIYGYARVSTDGQSVTAQVAALRKHGAGKVFREVASGAKTDRAQLRRLLDQLDADDVLMVTRLDRLARSTRDLLNTLAAITGRKAVRLVPRGRSKGGGGGLSDLIAACAPLFRGKFHPRWLIKQRENSEGDPF